MKLPSQERGSDYRKVVGRGEVPDDRAHSHARYVSEKQNCQLDPSSAMTTRVFVRHWL